jgi:hypothetical protein
MSTWEERMAQRTRQRGLERERIERAAAELRQAEQDRQRVEWLASLPPCPCPYDPCPMPPDYPYWEMHRSWWEHFNQTGRCADCGQAMTVAEVDEHDCPNGIVLAG